ncbi:MAG: copper homeostasis protein CutC [Bacteroidales bacterium]|nr:copper homeostasis protein CutC [Bacteroidales bacterium]
MNEKLKYKLEACVASFESVKQAIAGGADRLELCSHLSCGGLTPSPGLIRQTIEYSPVPVNILIRPRAGNFVYNKSELEVIECDIRYAHEMGAAGIVCGFLREDGSVDKEKTCYFRELSKPLSFTFHRAFDLCPDPFQALEDLIDCGIDRILTSGQQDKATEGIDFIEKLVEKAAGRIIIMPGGGINAENVGLFLEKGVKEVHASGSVSINGQINLPDHPALSDNIPSDNQIKMTSKEKIAGIKEKLMSC